MSSIIVDYGPVIERAIARLKAEIEASVELFKSLRRCMTRSSTGGA